MRHGGGAQHTARDKSCAAHVARQQDLCGGRSYVQERFQRVLFLQVLQTKGASCQEAGSLGPKAQRPLSLPREAAHGGRRNENEGEDG